MTAPTLDQLCVDTIRTLSIDAVQQAQSGHPGTPMGMAPAAYALWQRMLRYDPEDPHWPNRDRFVLSAGHASMLLYSLIHLTGVRAADASYESVDRPAVTLDDIKRFRQAGSRCPGHPEHGWTTGVEATTGPLGQGVAMSVGMAIAGRWLGATYNRPDLELFDYDVYVLCSDGDMMEGLGSEAASLAGHLRLGRLCWIYDNNGISIEGPTSLTFTEDVGARFLAYGWNVLRVPDANDLDRLTHAYETFRATHDRPTLIIVDSHIGYGAPHRQDTREAHGEPLGAEETRLAKEFYGWNPDARFVVPDAVPAHFRANLNRRGADLRAAWEARLGTYRERYPDLAAQLDRIRTGTLPPGWDGDLPVFPPDPKGIASRDASGKTLNAIARRVPWLLGGAADLWPSTKTRLTFEGAGELEPVADGGDAGGRNLHFGVREHAMCAIANGMALSGLRAYGSSFLIFTDYCRAALRLSALMELPVLYVWTHDSISLGEDGPTHQPVEHLASLRAMPGMIVIRPADANEVVEAYRVIMTQSEHPVSLVLSRQALPTLDRSQYAAAAELARGAYVLADAPDGEPDVLLLATGSEVSLCVTAHERLLAEGIKARVVSMPSWELFEAQPESYREKVLPPEVLARVAVEEASPFGWARYTGLGGTVLGMRTFGLSAPAQVVAEHFGFTADHVVEAAREQVARQRRPSHV
ncbi:MAG TPA: transketolase [Gemmatimonadales bacterium]|jgi:transketolase|nr:transketolase [Gemmatimonadales bacterium]